MQSNVPINYQRCPHCNQAGFHSATLLQNHTRFCHFKLLDTARQHATGANQDAKITMKMRDQLMHTLIDEYATMREDLVKLRSEVAQLRRVRIGPNSSVLKRHLASLPIHVSMTQWLANIRVSNSHISRVLEGQLQDGIIDWFISGIKADLENHPFASFELCPNKVYAYLPDKSSEVSTWTQLTSKNFEPFIRNITQKFLAKFHLVMSIEKNPKRHEVLMEHASKFFACPSTSNANSKIIRAIAEHVRRTFPEQHPDDSEPDK
jgi:hypothetical protein